MTPVLMLSCCYFLQSVLCSLHPFCLSVSSQSSTTDWLLLLKQVPVGVGRRATLSFSFSLFPFYFVLLLSTITIFASVYAICSSIYIWHVAVLVALFSRQLYWLIGPMLVQREIQLQTLDDYHEIWYGHSHSPHDGSSSGFYSGLFQLDLRLQIFFFFLFLFFKAAFQRQCLDFERNTEGVKWKMIALHYGECRIQGLKLEYLGLYCISTILIPFLVFKLCGSTVLNSFSASFTILGRDLSQRHVFILPVWVPEQCSVFIWVILDMLFVCFVLNCVKLATGNNISCLC